MTVAIFFAGILVGAALTMPGAFVAYREWKIAEKRLHEAWQSGVIIPPRPEKPAPKKAPDEPIPPNLMQYVMDWEGQEAQERAAGEIRDWQAEGLTEAQMIRLLESRHGE